jgi:hypothetical protein
MICATPTPQGYVPPAFRMKTEPRLLGHACSSMPRLYASADVCRLVPLANRVLERTSACLGISCPEVTGSSHPCTITVAQGVPKRMAVTSAEFQYRNRLEDRTLARIRTREATPERPTCNNLSSAIYPLDKGSRRGRAQMRRTWFLGPSPCIWRARQDLNPRSPGSYRDRQCSTMPCESLAPSTSVRHLGG